jgi:phosphoglycolate phosphatase-like HAD superfamily hydrolase
MHVFCFDFDGVICDSAPETALAAWAVCAQLWPEFSGPLPDFARERFCRLRPVMLTGWEAIPLMRLAATSGDPDERILADFPALRDGIMAAHGLSSADLRLRFGAVRDAMVARDEDAWVRLNPFYAGMAELLAETMRRHEVFIITTKQERFTSLLLRRRGVPVEGGRVFGLERDLPKPAILEELLRRPGLAGRTFHFIEDRLETLEEVRAIPLLAAVRLALADWGYNTPAQRQRAASAGIEVVALPRLRALCRSESDDKSG